jgi:NIPSNAP
MNRRKLLQSLPLAALLPASAWSAALSGVAQTTPEGSMIFELRVYHVLPGKLNDLVARFRDHTDTLFAQHGMKSVAYWMPLEEPQKSNTFIYILQHPSREAAAANWKSFQADPAWVSVKEKSEANGKLVEKIDSTFMALTDFSKQLS